MPAAAPVQPGEMSPRPDRSGQVYGTRARTDSLICSGRQLGRPGGTGQTRPRRLGLRPFGPKFPLRHVSAPGFLPDPTDTSGRYDEIASSAVDKVEEFGELRILRVSDTGGLRRAIRREARRRKVKIVTVGRRSPCSATVGTAGCLTVSFSDREEPTRSPNWHGDATGPGGPGWSRPSSGEARARPRNGGDQALSRLLERTLQT
jgi:hypothetical protein